MMVCGAVSVMKEGTRLMHTSSANSWDMQGPVIFQHDIGAIYSSLFTSVNGCLYTVSIAYHYAFFGAGNGPIIYSNVDCGGWEESFSECSKASFPQFFCLQTSVSGLLCGYGKKVSEISFF